MKHDVRKSTKWEMEFNVTNDQWHRFGIGGVMHMCMLLLHDKFFF
jgi:hypothetical protein